MPSVTIFDSIIGDDDLSGSKSEDLGVIAFRAAWDAPAGSFAEQLAWCMAVEVTDAGLPIRERNFKRRSDGGLRVIITFEGALDPTAEGESFELSGTTAEEKIETHPEIEMLREKYGGRYDSRGNISFPPTIADPESGERVRNPMAGTSTYNFPGLVWTREWTAAEFPSNLVQRLGCIDQPDVGQLGQRPPSLKGRHQWFCIRVTGRWRGNVWQISMSHTLTDEGGANADIYRRR